MIKDTTRYTNDFIIAINVDNSNLVIYTADNVKALARQLEDHGHIERYQDIEDFDTLVDATNNVVWSSDNCDEVIVNEVEIDEEEDEDDN